MLLRKIFREIPFIYRVYRKLIFPKLLNKDLNIKFLKNYKFNTSIDVGANVGTYAVELQKNSSQLLCFEPILRNIKFLKILLNRNSKFFAYALGNENKKIDIKIPIINKNQYDYALSSINNDFQSFKKKNITIKKFDDIFFKKYLNSNIDFVKIDVEGHEYFVLKGMKKTIKKNRPIFLIEIEKRHDKSYNNTLKFLKYLGYKTYITEDGKNLSYLSYETANKFIQNKKYNNFFFINKF